MKLILNRMRIENFKGFRNTEIDFSDTVTRIGGRNASGKSSIVDAFNWVLFNKDARGNAPGTNGFREKPMDADGNEIHNVDTTVELSFKLDGAPFILRRTQRENWVKKRGNTDATFQGNVSTYWINDVETKLTDFKARIDTIAPEDVFRMIGTLSAFNALDWKKRRQHLLTLSGADVDAELLQRQEYRPIADEIAQRGVDVEGLAKIIADQRKRTNNELQMFPVRIDEVKRSLPAIRPHELEDAEFLMKDVAQSLVTVETKLAGLHMATSTGASAEQILALESELLSIKHRITDVFNGKKWSLRNERDGADIIVKAASLALSRAQASASENQRRIEELNAERTKLRDQYGEAYKRTLEFDQASVCPTCGQAIPEEQLAAARDAAQKAFNESKRKELETIKAKGVLAATSIAALEANTTQDNERMSAAEMELHDAKAKREEAEAAVNAFPAEPDFTAEPRIAELEQQIAALKAERSQSPDEKIRLLEERKRELNETLDRARATLAKRDAMQAVNDRIAELEKQQQDAGARLVTTEWMLALLGQFTQDRCMALEQSINDRFPTVRWKLFDTQINGGITDTCICMIPCESGLVTYDSANTAAQINADVEITNVLSEHYDVFLPLFVDNAERINFIRPTGTQLITLSVTTDDGLRVEQEAIAQAMQ